MDTVVVFPVLRRPWRVAPLLDSLAAATPEPHRVLFVCTLGDTEEIAAVEESGAAMFVIPPNGVGDYAKKINAAYRGTVETFLFCGADDLHFHPGWLGVALEVMADPTVGVVGTNDLGNARVMAGEHSTHSLVRRSYVVEHGTVDEHDKVLHEGYPHEFVDDEFVQTAKARRAFRFAAESTVEHLHPNWGKGRPDALYAAQPDRMRRGWKIYRKRQRLWLT